ncbi:synaptic vesicle 2-related protein [Elysia marginata]|uniref:Synaptic vesicle 2-related protein n=1 Tax=Elysia marginata TaxID=1093978 RepID=A0AAV4G211_9GAST|nr:synaptic vesicle 2-related protein [Elysia marginata]
MMSQSGNAKSLYSPVDTADRGSALVSSEDEAGEETLFQVGPGHRSLAGNMNIHGDARKRNLEDRTTDMPDSDGEENGQTYTLEEAVEALGLGWFQIRMFLVCGTISAADALEMLLLAFLSPIVRCEWYLTDAQVAFVTTVVFLGMGIAAPLLGIFGDKYGRKTTLVFVTLVIGYFGLLATGSPSYPWLLFLRGVVGCGMGGSPHSTALMSEYFPKKYRAKMLTGGQTFFAAGVLFEVLLASVVVPTLGWRWLMAGSAVPVLIAASGLFFVPESARFLLAAGKREKAIGILKEAARQNGSHLPPGKLVKSQKIPRGQLKNLFGKEYLRTTLQLWVLWMGFAFMYYGIVLAATELMRIRAQAGDKAGSGQPCHCKYMTTQDYNTMIISTLGEFACLPVNMVLLDWVGRRRTGGLICFTLCVLMSLLAVQDQMSRAVFTLVLFAARGLSSSFGNLLYIYTAELYPTTIRTLGMGTASAWARVGAMVTPFVAQVFLSWSPVLACLVYASFALVCSVCSFWMPIETMERALPQSVSMEMTELPPDQKALIAGAIESESE